VACPRLPTAIAWKAPSTPREHPKRVSLPAGDRGVLPGGAERAEEGHVGLVESLAAGELSASRWIDQLSVAVTETVLVRRRRLPGQTPSTPLAHWSSLMDKLQAFRPEPKWFGGAPGSSLMWRDRSPCVHRDRAQSIASVKGRSSVYRLRWPFLGGFLGLCKQAAARAVFLPADIEEWQEGIHRREQPTQHLVFGLARRRIDRG
jgi:hypothetical protein